MNWFSRQGTRIIRILGILSDRIYYINKQRVLVLGDSHVAIFNFINKQYKLPYYFEVGYVSGATSLGIANPNSKTNSLNIFRKKLRKTSLLTPVIIQMGEVDCGFVIWFLSEKKKTIVKEQFDKSINNYKNFIQKELIERGFKNIIIMSATLPTLKENVEGLGEIANLRKEVKSSQKERTELTLKYNNELRRFCASSKELHFLDFDQDLIGDNGIIKDRFLNKDPLDHHNDKSAYAQIIVNKLKTNNYTILK